MKILVLNTGSSSVKYRLFDGTDTVAKGLIERIGEPDGDAADHAAALRRVMDDVDLDGLAAVGHRVVHGGAEFAEPSKSRYFTDEEPLLSTSTRLIAPPPGSP